MKHIIDAPSSTSVLRLNYAVTVMGHVNTELSTERCECLVGFFWRELDAVACFERWDAHGDARPRLYVRTEGAWVGR